MFHVSSWKNINRPNSYPLCCSILKSLMFTLLNTMWSMEVTLCGRVFRVAKCVIEVIIVAS